MSAHFYRLKMVSRIGCPELRRLFIAIVVLSALSVNVIAHTPSGVEVSYNEKSGDLNVAITHPVDNPGTHYVKRVTIRQGSMVLIDTSYTNQPDISDFNYSYFLPGLKGSAGEITVDAECNLFGSRSGTLILTRTEVPVDTQFHSDSQQPAPSPTKSGTLPFLAILAAGLIGMRIRQ